MSDASSAADWAAIVTDAYCADAKPPLTQELADRVRDALAGTIASSTADASKSLRDRRNSTLDAFESELRDVIDWTNRYQLWIIVASVAVVVLVNVRNLRRGR